MNVRISIVLLLFFIAPPANALEDGFILAWEKKFPNKLTDLVTFEYDRDYILNDIAVTSLDNSVYVYNQDRMLKGMAIGKSSFTSITTYSSEYQQRQIYLAAGSLDDLIYGMWKPYSIRYLYTDTAKPKVPHSLHWYYNTGDNVYSLTTVDLDERRRKEYIVAGIGSYYSDSPGAVIALNSTGSLVWSHSTGTAVTSLAAADLDGDSFVSHVIAGFGSSIAVLDNGSATVWSHSFDMPVAAISPADLDKDEQLTDILVAAGDQVYALSAKNKVLWTWKANGSVVSISYVDKELDGIIDYYLVAGGTTLYALQNRRDRANVLWSYDTGRKITKHVSFDLDGSYMPADVAVLSENSLLVYRKALLALPRLTLDPYIPEDRIKGKDMNLGLSIYNSGDRYANNITIYGALYLGQEVLKNISDTLATLEAGEEENFIFAVKDPDAGNYTLKLNINYTDPYEIEKNLSNLTFFFEIEDIKADENGSIPEQKLPQLEISRSLSSMSITEGKSFAVNITVSNEGTGDATNVTFDVDIGEEFKVVEGNVSWSGEIEAGKSMNFSYTLKPKRKLLRVRTKGINVTAVSLEYEDGEGETYSSSLGEIEVDVASWKVKFLLLVIPIGAITVVLRGKRGKKEENLDEKFLKIYKTYKEKGKAPSYNVFMKELGVDKKTLGELVKRLKEEGKI